MNRSSSMPAYRQIISLWVQTGYVYRAEVVIELVAMLLKIFLLKVVWTSVYSGRSEVDGIPLDEVIAFMTLANLQLYLLSSQITGYLYGRIREGLIALDLARPVPFLGQLMANQLGSTIAFAPFILLALPVALFAGGLQLPASLPAALLYLVSLVFAYMITSLISMLLGLLAFWTTEIWGIRSILDFVSSFFSGALVPLWFFPPAIRSIADWLPFQGQAHLPLAIYLGRLEGQTALIGIGVQAFWVLVLGGMAVLVWRRAMQRVVVQGG